MAPTTSTTKGFGWSPLLKDLPAREVQASEIHGAKAETYKGTAASVLKAVALGETTVEGITRPSAKKEVERRKHNRPYKDARKAAQRAAR